MVTRARFKYALRHVRNHEEQLRNDLLSRKLACNESKVFWSKIKTENDYKFTLPKQVGGAKGETEIVNMWTNIFSELLNSTSSDNADK